jgi:predicted small metal-binding protein
MKRLYIDCREFPSESKCTVAISAESADELLEIAVQHAVSIHKDQDTPELRKQLRQMFKPGMPSADMPKAA